MSNHIESSEIIPCGPSKDKRFQNLLGATFRRLFVVEIIGLTRKGRSYVWKCLCVCGNYTNVRSGDLTSGKTKSCGCLNREKTRLLKRTHGLSHTLIYKTWFRMLKRCGNPLDQDWKHYGGRGITVCERWEDFENFYADMGPKPSDKHSIDRINTDGNYEPANCRWATQLEQVRNRRSNRYITHNGETMCASEWARRLGLTPRMVLGRLQRGYSPEEALTVKYRSRIRRPHPGAHCL